MQGGNGGFAGDESATGGSSYAIFCSIGSPSFALAAGPSDGLVIVTFLGAA